MLLNPRIGQRVQVWYAKNSKVFGPNYRDYMPLHGKIGIIVFRSCGKPRNHGVEIDGKFYSIPCGNLRKVADNAGN